MFGKKTPEALPAFRTDIAQVVAESNGLAKLTKDEVALLQEIGEKLPGTEHVSCAVRLKTVQGKTGFLVLTSERLIVATRWVGENSILAFPHSDVADFVSAGGGEVGRISVVGREDINVFFPKRASPRDLSLINGALVPPDRHAL